MASHQQWYMDTRATSYLSSHTGNLQTSSLNRNFHSIIVENESSIPVTHSGHITQDEVGDSFGQRAHITLHSGLMKEEKVDGKREKTKVKLEYLSSFMITRVFEEAYAKNYSLKEKAKQAVAERVTAEFRPRALAVA
uniref:Uncharacterized protein n=1 Tax=Tanacetum cinerariifolium TaxID=118510 RepID=A0A6L2K4L0_TANCI|nr:hypothetical protein [Tanacetum cinerariifolium]